MLVFDTNSESIFLYYFKRNDIIYTLFKKKLMNSYYVIN
jgi:hypothetical protein